MPKDAHTAVTHPKCFMVYIGEDTYEELFQYCHRNGTKMARVARELLTEFLADSRRREEIAG